MEQNYNGFIFKEDKIYFPNIFLPFREMTLGREFMFAALGASRVLMLQA